MRPESSKTSALYKSFTYLLTSNAFVAEAEANFLLGLMGASIKNV